jgi:hypothetical protein
MASSDTPELDELIFYQELISSYSDLYTKAQESCSIIIIPQHLTNPSSLTRDIIESHLYRPSPCYLRKHLSWNEKYEIEYDNNRTLKVFYKKESVGEKCVKVISREDVRDSIRQRAYSILIVDQPIVDINTTRNSQNGLGRRPSVKPFIQPVRFLNQNFSSLNLGLFFLVTKI